MTSNAGGAAKDSLRAPRAEDLVAAGAACLPVYYTFLYHSIVKYSIVWYSILSYDILLLLSVHLEESCCFVCSTWHSFALLIASEAKRVQSPKPHTPRAVASPVDGTKARGARTSRGLRLYLEVHG